MVAVLLAAAGLVAGCTPGSSSPGVAPSTLKPSTWKPPLPGAVQLGGCPGNHRIHEADVVVPYDWTISVDNVTDAPAASGAATRPVALDVTLHNSAPKPQYVVASQQFRVCDQTHVAYVLTSAAGTIASPIVAPGATVKGHLIFTVPSSSKQLVLLFRPELLESRTSNIALGV